MKVRITVDLDERCRRAIAMHYGHEGLATKELCISNLDSVITAHLGNLAYEMDEGVADDLAEEDA